ncbi:MAG: guanylate kinase [Lachnospiraceae bacterium]|nr:guanylate kinase [Lachnospiraceae bacterium]MDD6147918.1 guanylate kinase [Lachnospiraceae bacterium]
MGKIYVLLGKSASGKDTIAKKVMKKMEGKLHPIVPYTTRPIRDGEENGKQYYFVTDEEKEKLIEQGVVVEMRTYQTVNGPWSYFTVDDGNIDLEHNDYLIIGTLESLVKIQTYFTEERVVPIYINVDDGDRLMRAIQREKEEEHPNYKELCRRFLADENDYSEENRKSCNIHNTVENVDLDQSVEKVIAIISKR